MKKFAFFILLFSISIFQSKGQWTWQNPVPQGNLLRAMQMIASTETGYAVGPFGTAIMTSDNGMTWSNLDSLTSEDLNGLFFLNESLGYLVGNNGTILKLNTSGEWTFIETGSHYALNAVAFADEQTGIFAGYKGLVFTSDGATVNQVTINTNYDLHDVEFLNNTDAIMIGDSGLILKSTNAGQSWQTINSGVNKTLNDICFTSSQTGYIAGQKATILKTTDGGESWADLSSTVIDNNLYGVSFTNDTMGYVVGTYGMVLHTTNGGLTWHYRGIPTDGSLYAVHQLALPTDSTPDLTMVCGSFGAIYQTDSVTASGYYWKNISGGNSHSISSMNINIDGKGWAVGGDLFGDVPDILETSNGGDDWTIIDIDTVKHFLNDISYAGNDRSYVCGSSGSVYRIANDIWTPLITGTTEDIYGIAALDINLVYAAGLNGTIIKTISSDTLWETLSVPTDLNLFDITFINSSTGYAVGEEGIVLRIKSGGAFIQKINQVWTPMYSIYFLNDSLGFMAGFGGKIYKINIVDGQEEFTNIPSGVSAALNQIQFPTYSTGFIAGDGGTVLKTTDGGNSWYPVYTGTSNGFRTLQFSNSSVGYVAGAGMSILKTTIGGGSVILPGIFENPASEIPIRLYPNPVSDHAWLEYELANKNRVNITVLDLSGSTLLEVSPGMQGRGLHRLQIPLENVQQGIYLVMIQIGNHAYARKMIMMK